MKQLEEQIKSHKWWIVNKESIRQRIIKQFFERKDLTKKIGTLLSILLKKNSATSTEQDETTENTQSLSKIA